MSTITNEAIIKVTTDATGVEEGGRRIDASTARTGKNLDNLAATAKRTGKSLDDLSSSSGMRAVGDGAGAAAGKVDRATLTMAASIQRATAAANAGAKSGADFYASLANSRGLNMTALRPYLDQLDAVTRKTAQAAAAQRQLDAGNSFLDGLRSQADGIGKTASQLAALRAEQLGVADDARPLIEQLQAAEEAAGNAGNSVSGFSAALASVAFGGGIAAVAQLSDQYGKYLAQLKLATTGQSEFTNAQNAVRSIATSAQSDLSATASLYASITKSTRDLGIAQSQVAGITESVSLALKVSGASTGEASSAILQLSQAFASGVLRGDEFNSVNEASPRLMQALADGIGVPVGALRAMAEQGQLTTAVLADALPRALGTLRNEARSVETIGGAVTVLKNNVMEMVGATAQSSGVVTVLSGSINLLADNLTLAAGAMGTVVAVKLGTSLHASAAGAVASMMANRALALSNLASAQSNVAATAAASATAAARVNELRAAVLVAEGNVALAITNNGLIPAQARATAAASAHAAALTAQATAARAASVSGGLAGAALTALGGPVGAVIAVLGIAATAWAVFGNKAEQANDQATQSTEESTGEMIVRLDEQIKKLRERNALAAQEPRIKALDGISEVDKDGLARAKAALDANKAAQAAAGTDARARMMLQLEEVELSGKYEGAMSRVKSLQGEVATAALRTRTARLDDWYAQNGSSAQRLAAELDKLKKEFGAIPPEMEKLVRAKFADPASAKALKSQAAAAKEYADLVDRINGKSAGVDPDYQDNLLKLSAGYSAGKQSLEAYRATVEAYIAQQPFAKQAEEDRLRALKEVSDFQDSYSKGLEATSGIYAKRAQDAEAEAVRNEDLARTYGMAKSAIEALEVARLQEQLAQRSTLGLTLDEIENLEKLIDLKQRSTAAVAAMEQVDAAKKAAEEWKRASESIEQSLTDALLRGFESGKDFGQNLVDTLKNMFGTLVLRPIISVTVNPLAASLTNTLGLGGGAAGASSAAGGFASAASGVSNLYSMVSGGATVAGGLGTGFLGSLAGGLNGAGIGSGLTSALGMNIGNGIASVVGSNVASGIATGLSGLAAAAPWVAGALAFYTIGKKAFGRGPKEYSGDQTLNGSLGAGGFSGTMDAAWVKKGGWLRSDKEGVDKNQVGAEVSAGLTSAYDAIKASSADFADVLGLNAASIASRSQAIKIALGKDDAANQAAIAEFFVGVANTVAAELLPEIGKFQVKGEEASATLQRLAVNFSAVDQILMVMGATSQIAFGAVGKDSIEARERLVALAGGIEALAEKTNFFNDNFLSQAERVANAQGPLNEKLASLGFAGITTSEQFKDAAQGLVKSGALANEAGAKIYAELLALGPQYKLVSDYLKEASDTAAEAAATLASSKRGLEIQIMQLLGDKAGALAATRALELGEMDASLRPLRERVYALEDEAAALGTANSLLSIQAQIYELTGDKAGAAAVLSQQHINALAALDPALRGATQNLWDLQAAAKATEQVKTAAAALMSGVDGAFSALQKVVERQKKATQEEIDVRTKAVEKTRSLSEALRSTLDGLTVAGTEKNDRAAAQAQIQAALAIAKASGILPKADDLKNALSVIGKDSTGLFASQEDYLRDFYATKNGITDLAKITDKTLSAEERSLKALEGQVKQYDDMLEREQEQIDVLKGISTIGLSIEQAIQALHGAMGAAGANPYNSATSQISDAYKSSLGRAPDAAGLSYWQDRAAGGISTEAIIGSIKGSPEAQIQALYKDVFGRPADAAGLSYWIDRLKGGISLGSIRETFEKSAEKKLRGFAVGTNYVPADMPAQIHQGERIIPAADNRELMRRLASPPENNDVLAAAVDRLTATVARQEAIIGDLLVAQDETQRNTRRLADGMEIVTDGWNAARVKQEVSA
ncbi:tape measure protein [Oxalobacteraceae sp. CFBP 13708]|nr:tape measure protein [Oxalobacteraceae sp. CFBP 13708]